MSANAAAMQALAVKYQQLAGEATDERERRKLYQYAALYREMAAQASRALRLERAPSEV